MHAASQGLGRRGCVRGQQKLLKMLQLMQPLALGILWVQKQLPALSLAQQQLAEYDTELKLKQNVYKAHNDALNSIQKYNAAKRADDAAKRALDFARKRYDLGLTDRKSVV